MTNKTFVVVVISAILISSVICCTTLVFTPKATGFAEYNVLVEVVRTDPLFGNTAYSMGSGVVVSEDGVILTAGHVLREAREVRVTLHDGRTFDVNDFYVDDEYDVGFINLSYNMDVFIPLSDSNMVNDGDKVFHIGNPGGIETDIRFNGRVSDSCFKRLALGKDVGFILTVMDAEHGCSGGGVYADDKLIGIVVIKIDKFTIIVPSNICKSVMDEWLGNRDAS